MQMNSTENPLLPCNEERAELDFDAIVREIVGQQKSIWDSLPYSIYSHHVHDGYAK